MKLITGYSGPLSVVALVATGLVPRWFTIPAAFLAGMRLGIDLSARNQHHTGA